MNLIVQFQYDYCVLSSHLSSETDLNANNTAYFLVTSFLLDQFSDIYNHANSTYKKSCQPILHLADLAICISSWHSRHLLRHSHRIDT